MRCRIDQHPVIERWRGVFGHHPHSVVRQPQAVEERTCSSTALDQQSELEYTARRRRRPQMKNPRAPRFVPFGFLMAHVPQSGKKFRATLATVLICLMLAPQPSLAQTQTYSCPNGFGPVGGALGAPVAPV